MASEIKKSVIMFFPVELYSYEAVSLASYIYEDKADIALSQMKDGVNVAFQFSGEENLAGDFANEVLNQQCRIDLIAKTGKITNMIASKSLLSAVGEIELNK